MHWENSTEIYKSSYHLWNLFDVFPEVINVSSLFLTHIKIEYHLYIKECTEMAQVRIDPKNKEQRLVNKSVYYLINPTKGRRTKGKLKKKNQGKL